ncbi:MAG TPA: M56 family metallopeptidase [Croceibacterium sp.]|nr:M56 family metallopeptidase [Croceibacterium sp.]
MTAWLTGTLLYTGLLIALVLLVRRPLSRWFGPQFAYALWALPALRLLLPPIELPASMAPQQAQQLSEHALLALAMAAEASPTAASAPTPLWERTDLWLTLWLVSAALFLAWRIVNYFRMRRELLAEARPVGQVGRIRLVETPAVSSPVAFGVYDKVVALPPRFMAMEDRAARDLAIAHELAHHQGHDVVANFAAQPLLALHWFNPLAWMGWRAMRRDQEAACDARVLAGRDRDVRAAYAGLIANFAAGPRLALAVPMACPIIGEKSIIHRLRSLSMSDVSPRRRTIGRLLFVAGALALPLTASFSYASAQDNDSHVVPVPPSDAPAAPLPPAPPQEAGVPQVPSPPLPPEAPKIERREQKFVLRHDGDHPGEVNDLGPGEHHMMVMRVDGPMSAEQKKQFEEMQKEWEKKGAEWQKMAKDHQKMALAMSDMRAHMPQVSNDCDQAGGDVSRSWTDNNGREHVVICERRIREQAQMGQHEAQMAQGQALMALRDARTTIATTKDMSDSVRQEVLADLDREIARLTAQH